MVAFTISIHYLLFVHKTNILSVPETCKITVPLTEDIWLHL